VPTAEQPQTDETVRILIPDHPDLALGRAVEFGGSLRHANDTDDDVEPWQLPDQLIAPELEQALFDAVLHQPWFRHVGDDREDARTEIQISHAGIGHMGVYITTMERAQLQRLVDAAALLRQADSTPFAERTPLLAEIGAFVERWRDADKHDDIEPALSAWLTVVALMAIAIAEQPTAEHRPERLLDHRGNMVPVASSEGTSPAADTALVLEQIDAAGDAREVDLDAAAFLAFRRLTSEWHIAIFDDRSTDPMSMLSSYAY
jgi:hypothetical protein